VARVRARERERGMVVVLDGVEREARSLGDVLIPVM